MTQVNMLLVTYVVLVSLLSALNHHLGWMAFLVQSMSRHTHFYGYSCGDMLAHEKMVQDLKAHNVVALVVMLRL